MRPLVKTPLLGFVGLFAVALVALGLLRGNLTLAQAANRATIALLTIIAVERIVLPLAQLLVGSPAQPAPIVGIDVAAVGVAAANRPEAGESADPAMPPA